MKKHKNIVKEAIKCVDGVSYESFVARPWRCKSEIKKTRPKLGTSHTHMSTKDFLFSSLSFWLRGGFISLSKMPHYNLLTRGS